MKPVRLAILGLGTVGGGALKLLKENAAEIKRRTGRGIEITHVGTRRPRPDLAAPTTGRRPAPRYCKGCPGFRGAAHRPAHLDSR